MIDNNNAVTDLVLKENIMIFSFKNGLIEIFKRDSLEELFERTKLKSEDDETVIGLKIS